MSLIKKQLKRLLPHRLWRTLRHIGSGLLNGIYRIMSFPVKWIPEGTDGGVACYLFAQRPLTPATIILGYHQGLFPSGKHGDGEMRWHEPDQRFILPVDELHIAKRLKRIMRKEWFEIRFDTNFRGVMEGCAESKDGRKTTWLTQDYIDTYVELNHMGFAHSFEAWQDGQLVGGGYGVALGGCFSVESLFHKVDNANKVAFVHFVNKLRDDGFTMLDLWWPTAHFAGFGATAISRNNYRKRFAQALLKPVEFTVKTNTYESENVIEPTPEEHDIIPTKIEESHYLVPT